MMKRNRHNIRQMTRRLVLLAALCLLLFPLTAQADPCDPDYSPSPGQTCDDGSIYAGLSPDGNVPMYTTPADAPSTYTWNDGTTNYTDMAMANCTDGSPGTATSCQTGAANTAFLVGATGEPDYPFAAAEYCGGLSAHGYDDWYLPAQDELNVLYTNKNAGDLDGTFNETGSYPAGYYWSSSENNNFIVRRQRFSDGFQNNNGKNGALPVRCVRKGYISCSNPDGVRGEMHFNTERSVMEYCDGDKWINMGLGSYTPVGAYFDGTNDRLETTGVTAGTVDTKKVTASVWFRNETSSGDQSLYHHGNASRFNIALEGSCSQCLIIGGQNAATTQILNVVGPSIADNDWHHLLFSFDLSDPAGTSCTDCHFYLDGVDMSPTINTFTDDTLDLDDNLVNIAGVVPGWQGGIADLWFETGTYIDFSSAAMREKFISPNGMPMFLGDDGSLPTGSPPDIFLTGDVADWHTNKGTGGGFTETGTLTFSSSGPGSNLIGGDSELMFSAYQTGSCALKTDGSVTCWGAVSSPAGTDYRAVGVGAAHACAIKTDGSLDCWGSDSDGQATPPGGTDYVYVAAGYQNSCAIRTDDSLVCWGRDTYGEVSNVPVDTFVSVGLSQNTTCAVKTDGSLACWGWDSYGEVSQMPAGNDFVSVTGGRFHFCALKTDGSLDCWGSDGSGQSTPPGGTNYVTLDAGHNHNCAIKTDGSLDCWGSDSSGQSTPPAGTNYVAFSAGQQHSCALQSDGFIACWGGAPAGSEPGTDGFGSPLPCTFPSGAAGELIFNADYNVMQYCNGVDWVAMSKIGGTGGGGCADPVGTGGEIFFRSTDEVMQYCNSQAWVNIGKAAAPTSDLVGHWRLDETDVGPVIDSAGSNDGTLVGGLDPSVDSVPGVVGSALLFDEVSEAIQIPDFDYGPNFTVSFWYKLTDNTGSLYQYIVSHGTYNTNNSLNIYTEEESEPSDRVAACIKDSDDSVNCDTARLEGSSGVGVDNNWHMLTLTVSDTDGSSLYLDGNTLLENVSSYGGDAYNPTTDLFLGGREDLSANRFFGGALDEVRIYNRALDDGEIWQLYQATK